MLKRSRLVLPLQSNSINLKKVKNDLTFTDEQGSFTAFYDIAGAFILIPRFYFTPPLQLRASDVFEQSNVLFDSNFHFKGQLKQDVPQEDAVSNILKSLQTFSGAHAVMPCGFGKTVVALKIISQLQSRSIVLVNSDLLLQQWKERISTFLPRARVGIVKQDQCDIQSHIHIVVAMIQTLSRPCKAREDLFQSHTPFQLLIVDEAHHVPTNSLKQALWNIGRSTKYTLGLTATPNRRDGRTPLLSWMLGPRAYTAPLQKLIPTLFSIQRFYDTVEEHVLGNGKINLARLINDLAKSEARNRFIVDLISKQFTDERCILILSERKFQVKLLFSWFLRLHPDSSCGYIISENKKQSIPVLPSWKIIFSTYHMFKEGIDVPHLDCLVMASPVTNVEQSIGRIQRFFPRKTNALVFDIVDENMNILKKYFFKRMQFYKKQKFKSLSRAEPFVSLNNDSGIPMYFKTELKQG